MRIPNSIHRRPPQLLMANLSAAPRRISAVPMLHPFPPFPLPLPFALPLPFELPLPCELAVGDADADGDAEAEGDGDGAGSEPVAVAGC